MKVFDQTAIRNFDDMGIKDLDHASHKLASIAIALATSAPHSSFYNALFEHLKDHIKKLIVEHKLKESMKDLKTQSRH
jgi:predicted TPR repeat methyltransferase